MNKFKQIKTYLALSASTLALLACHQQDLPQTLKVSNSVEHTTQAQTTGDDITSQFGLKAVETYSDYEVAPGLRLFSKNGYRVAKLHLSKMKIGPIVKTVKNTWDKNSNRNRNHFEVSGMTGFWDHAAKVYGNTPVITFNAPFFGYSKQLANWALLSDYFSTNYQEFENGSVNGCALMINNTSQSAAIVRLENDPKAYQKYQHIIAGDRCLIQNGQAVKDYKFPVNETSLIGRTAIGIKSSTEVYVLVASSATVKNVTDEMKRFGVEQAMLFDGSGSSQMLINRQFEMPGDKRPLPLVFAAWKR